MTDIAAAVFAYGLAAGLSGTAFLATVVVLSTERGIANALALLGGFVVVLGAAVIGAALATGIITGPGGDQLLASIAKLALGLMLLTAAWRVRPGQAEDSDVVAKVAGMTAKLQGIGPATALRVGVGFALLPKRIMITLLAGAAIGASGVSVGQGLLLTGLYVLTATVLIWITIVVYLLGGTRAVASLDAAQAWLIANAAAVAFAVALLFGILFTGQAIVELLA